MSYKRIKEQEVKILVGTSKSLFNLIFLQKTQGLYIKIPEISQNLGNF